jgi:hypothetical protein
MEDHLSGVADALPGLVWTGWQTAIDSEDKRPA